MRARTVCPAWVNAPRSALPRSAHHEGRSECKTSSRWYRYTQPCPACQGEEGRDENVNELKSIAPSLHSVPTDEKRHFTAIFLGKTFYAVEYILILFFYHDVKYFVIFILRVHRSWFPILPARWPARISFTNSTYIYTSDYLCQHCASLEYTNWNVTVVFKYFHWEGFETNFQSLVGPKV